MSKKPTKPTIEDKLNITEMQETLNFTETPPLQKTSISCGLEK